MLEGGLQSWEGLRNRPLTLAEKRALREYYNGDYHRRRDYNSHHPWHQAIARHRAEITQAVFPSLGRVLDAGCAAGEEVCEFRHRGVDAWGFDVCSDLHDIAYLEVRPFVRVGGMDHMPFSVLDGFKTLVSFDVIEHVPIDSLERMPGELRRLGITQVSCTISNDDLNGGHITIQDTQYYVTLFARAGYRLMHELTGLLQGVLAPVAWNEDAHKPVYAPYVGCGVPRNGWNKVPGHLFFLANR